MKDIAAASGAPIGSLYHHFCAGKAQIGREALINAGAAYAMLIPSVVDDYTDLGEAIAETVEYLREATATVFTS